jgi:small subunit ribosomal protein S1
VDQKKKRISLGLKQVEGDPWTRAMEKYPSGAMVKGVILRMTDFGAFVELEKNIEGMIHVSEIAAKPPKKVQDVLQIGQNVEVKVLGNDPEKRRISLSIKALQAPASSPDKIELEREAGFDPNVIERKTTTWQKMLKKFMKKASEEDDDA